MKVVLLMKGHKCQLLKSKYTRPKNCVRKGCITIRNGARKVVPLMIKGGVIFAHIATTCVVFPTEPYIVIYLISPIEGLNTESNQLISINC